MKAANRFGARVVMVVGSGELDSGNWTVKDMQSGDQEEVADDDLESRLETLLGETDQ